MQRTSVTGIKGNGVGCLRSNPVLRRLMLAAFIGLVTPAVQGQELDDAGALLQRIENPATQPTTKPGANEGESLSNDIKAFKENAATLSDEEAAGQWLALVDRAIALSPKKIGMGNGVKHFGNVIEALPNPSAWDEIAAGIAARPADAAHVRQEAALRMLGPLLINDYDAAREQYKELRTSLRSHLGFGSTIFLRQMDEFINDGNENPTELIEQLEEMLAQSGSGGSYINTFEVPDLVTMVGEDKARKFFEDHVGSAVEFEVEVGDRTRAIAQEIVLANIDKLAVPQWSLVEPDSPKLYEALIAKYPSGKLPKKKGIGSFLGFGDDESAELGDYANRTYRAAQLKYLVSLIVDKRTEEAAALAREIGASSAFRMVSYSLTQAGHGNEVQAFLHTLLSDDPSLPFWESYMQLSAQAGKTDEMLALVRTVAEKRDSLPAEVRVVIDRQLFTALLAADKVDEAVAIGKRMLSDEAAATQPTAAEAFFPGIDSSGDGRATLAIELAQVGQVTGDADLVNEMLVIAQAELKELEANSDDDYTIRSIRQQISTVLQKSGRAAEAAAIWADAVAAAVKQSNEQRQQQYFYSGSGPRDAMIELLAIYHKAGRHKDVLTMLETFPYFGAKDLAEIYGESSMRADRTDTSVTIGLMAAAALADAGRTEEAQKIIEAVIDQAPGDDSAYELRVSLGGDDLIPYLDKVFSRDAFEERPLIWKAVVLHQQGNFAEAEKVAKEAVAIDPSDGEQGPDRRMRVYAVLADIAAATDRPDEAQFFRDVVEAIRISEKADAFFNAGLLARATGLYNQALEKFADAYCIQSRLARQYSELGQDDLAEQHYRRAFELMPSSFGRMESHCFGCEGAFSGPRAQATAEDVFGKLLASDPQNPKVHYLMGYLRSAQGNYPEAAERYREAVALDPLYINAWKNLLSTGERIHLPVEDRDKAKLAILKLDPLGRHSYSRDVDVRDLQQLWQISEDNSKLVPEKPTALLKLAAATNVEPNGHEDEVMQRIYSRLGRNEAATGGGAAVRSHKAVTMLVALVDGMP